MNFNITDNIEHDLTPIHFSDIEKRLKEKNSLQNNELYVYYQKNGFPILSKEIQIKLLLGDIYNAVDSIIELTPEFINEIKKVKKYFWFHTEILNYLITITKMDLETYLIESNYLDKLKYKEGVYIEGITYQKTDDGKIIQYYTERSVTNEEITYNTELECIRAIVENRFNFKNQSVYIIEIKK